MKPIIVIPARMGATRLPGKPLADIAGRPMIAHVVARALSADIGPVIVATDSPEIAEASKRAGARAVMTRADHASGSDRIAEAVEAADPGARCEVVVNLQGDLPLLDPAALSAAVALAAGTDVAIATLAAEIVEERERTDPNIVKVVGTPIGERRLRALYFTRAPAPSGPGPLYHHIGLYAYRREALRRFVALPQSPLERRERLEQLRALEAGMRIDVGIVDAVPLGIDTPEDLERARALIAGRGANDNGRTAA